MKQLLHYLKVVSFSSEVGKLFCEEQDSKCCRLCAKQLILALEHESRRS